MHFGFLVLTWVCSQNVSSGGRVCHHTGPSCLREAQVLSPTKPCVSSLAGLGPQRHRQGRTLGQRWVCGGRSLLRPFSPPSWGWKRATRVGISGLFSFFFYWTIAALQHCASLCCTMKWSSCMCTYTPSLPSWIFFFLVCFFIYLAMPYGMWDLCFPTRDGTCVLCVGKS